MKSGKERNSDQEGKWGEWFRSGSNSYSWFASRTLGKCQGKRKGPGKKIKALKPRDTEGDRRKRENIC